MTQPRVLIVDDHKMFSESFAELLKKITSFKACDQANSIKTAILKMEQHEYVMLFSDISMPGENVKELIGYSKQHAPQTKIIIVSSGSDATVVKELMGAGIDAYVSKGVGSYEIQMAIENVNRGEKFISTDIAAKIASVAFVESKMNLTKKEIEVLRLVAGGNTIAEIAEVLHLSTHTIVTHRRNIMHKLHVRSATEMVKFAYENNLC